MHEIPTPRISCRPGGGHWALCPDCGAEGAEFEVSVTEVAFLDGAGARRGSSTHYDLSAYERHYREAHGA